MRWHLDQILSLVGKSKRKSKKVSCWSALRASPHHNSDQDKCKRCRLGLYKPRGVEWKVEDKSVWMKCRSKARLGTFRRSGD